MGQMLPKPVESAVVERKSSKAFRVGTAELNGWRNDMEDAHLVHFRDTWGFFGVFDGHGGQECSKYVAIKLKEALEKDGYPADDAAVKRLVFSVDQDFLNTEQGSGSTATMCIINKPAAAGGRHQLRVINAGDSRVLLGRRDGTIVDGGGTDAGLTTDHKPSHPSERERIYRCGGHVDIAGGGVARVNGDLAVSRGFGDAMYKKTGGPGPEDRPVTADPELGNFECSDTDFVLLVCDGVSEGDFSNPQVVKLVADCLNENDDPGAAATAVCHKAVATGSRDNVTCMVVLVDGAAVDVSTLEFRPGSLLTCDHDGYMKAYTSMARKAGLTLGQAAEMRYELISKEIEEAGQGVRVARSLEPLNEELGKIGKPAGEKGSDARKAWFAEWERGSAGSRGDAEGRGMQNWMQNQLMQVSGRRVCAPEREVLEEGVKAHSALKWEEQLGLLCGKEGVVLKDDPNDGTTRVRFLGPGIEAWLPTDLLIDISGDEGSSGTA